MSRLSAGDDLALNELMARWQAPLLSFLYRSTGTHEDAVDLAQETFVRVYEHRRRYQPRGRFSTWLFTIASNLARNFARWRTRHPTVPLTGPEGESEERAWLATRAAPEPGPADSAHRQELARAVREEVHLLPHDLRTAVLLAEYEGLPQTEIAQVLGCTPKAVETRLYRARERLRQRLRAWQPH